MKCIHCDQDATRKERRDGKCPGCGRKFAFEPKSGDPLTDGMMKRAIDLVSADGAVRWLPENAWLELCRLQRRTFRPMKILLALAWLPVVVAVPIGGVLWQVHVLLGAPLLAADLWAAVVLVAAWKNLNRQPLTTRWELAKFLGWFQRYVAAHGTPKGLLQPKAPTPGKRPAIADEALDYSFDRAVVCDDARTADLLIANRFHFENNAAILGVDGHPAAVFDTVRAMLRNNPKLVVLALHDATPQGCRLAQKLKDEAWFAPTARIVDVGLRPDDAGMCLAQVEAVAPVRVTADASISADEALWLARYRLRVAALRPEWLVKRLFAALTSAEAKDAPGDGSVETYVFSGGDGTTADGGADSFG